MRRIALISLLSLLLAGCGPKLDPNAKAEADRVRVEAALGSQSYTSLETSDAVLTSAVWELLSHEQYSRLDTLFSAMEAAQLDWGDDLSPRQRLYQSLLPEKLGSWPTYEYYLDRWNEASPSKYPVLLKASALSLWLLNNSTWHNYEERQRITLQGSWALGALYRAGQVPAALEDPEYWECHLRIAVFFKEPLENLDKHLAEVVKRDPKRWSAYALRAYREHPHWQGGDYKPYLKAVQQLSQKHGPEVYAVCAWEVFEASHRKDAELRKIGLEWSKIKEGYDALRQAHPHSRTLLSKQSRLAVALGEDEAARALLDELGQDWDSLAWDGAQTHRQACELVGARPLATDPQRVVFPVGPEKELIDTIPFLFRQKLLSDTRALLSEERFWLLETMASKLSEEKDERRLRAFYLGNSETGSKAKTEISLGRCDRWDAAVPASPTARVVRAAILIDSAWDARGAGWASEVTVEGWTLFKSGLEKAATVLDGGELPDTYACALRITIARGRNEGLATVDQALDQAFKLDPESVLALHAKYIYLLPRWHGSRKALVALTDQVMKKRGDAILAKVLLYHDMREALLDELPYELVDRSLKAAEAEAKPVPGIVSLRAWVECYYWHREKALAALEKMVDKDEIWDWDNGSFESWRKALAGSQKVGRPSAVVIEKGQYSATLPKPTRLSSKATIPIVAGRTLGIRLRYQQDVPSFVRQTVMIERPRTDLEPGEGLYFNYTEKTLPPNTLRAGGEELIEWTIGENQQAPGPWTLTVLADGEVLASETFEMVASEAPSEPGLRLEYQGLVVIDRTRPLTPIAATKQVPMKMGVGFGILVSYTAMPTSGSYDWIIPPARPGAPEGHEGEALAFIGGQVKMPSNQARYFFEAPSELIPGNWKLSWKLDGRSVGNVTFEVGP